MQFITPNWAAPQHVKAVTTTRLEGVSEGAFASLNLGDHVDDVAEAVDANRTQLLQHFSPNLSAQWLKQVHSIQVLEAQSDDVCRQADGCWTAEKHLACIVMTADCLPVFFTNSEGDRVAVAHAGWRGLLDGVLEETLKVFSAQDDMHCWLGPAIGPNAFEVGAEVRTAFMDKDVEAESAFKAVPNKPDKFLGNLYALAKLRLSKAGVPADQITSCDLCTFEDSERFFSYRRDGQTGRMASLIWIDS